MPISNLGFETAGAGAGDALNWTLTSQASAFTIAAYDSEPEPWEDFEEGWDSNETYLLAFEDVDITAAEYETVEATPKLFDDFEEKWGTVASTGSIICVARASLVDGQTFTLDDGVNPAKVFEFDLISNGGSPGNVIVDLPVTVSSATQVRDAMVTAINGAGLFIEATPFNPGAVILLKNPRGFNIAITETVANAGFIVSGMSNGVQPENENYLFELGATLAADYDTGLTPYEDFEQEWNTNESYIFAHGPLTVASYDTVPEAFEDFSENWNSNETYLFAHGPLTTALYDVALTAREDFENEWPTLVMTTV